MVVSPPSSIPTTPIIELRQELTASRPLRSEVEKERRISSRWSVQSQHYLRHLSSEQTDSNDGKKINRDSIDTTDSTASEDDPPPPLPLKMREADYCSYSSIVNSEEKNISPSLDENCDNSIKPPTPPPKPKRPLNTTRKLSNPNNKISLHATSSD